jgi:hypothetical protein
MHDGAVVAAATATEVTGDGGAAIAGAAEKMLVEAMAAPAAKRIFADFTSSPFARLLSAKASLDVPSAVRDLLGSPQANALLLTRRWADCFADYLDGLGNLFVACPWMNRPMGIE